MLVALLLQVAIATPIAPAAFSAPDTASVTAAAGLAVYATRTTTPIRIDGVLDDSVWALAIPTSGLKQQAPKEGAAATEKTLIRVLYDDGAIYIGAEMLDATPDSIRTQLARRDTWVSADRFQVMLDTYHDKRTGFYFAINASGVQYDGTLYNDDWDDNTWDGVWQGAVKRTSTGWTAEMRIPYSQLRFKPGSAQVWGINFNRDIARRNERDYLVFTPSNGSGFVSRFLVLEGMGQLNPPRRIELLPYATGKAEFISSDPGNPFNDGSVYGVGVGGDFRVGLGSNLTITGTLNPDFGQVEVDPAVVNLSDVETFFPERRPFFVEGANIFNFGYGGSNNFWGFNWSSFDFLYTRRIGRAPTGATPVDADYVDEPGGTQILGAVKLSGKVGGWNVGALSALTRTAWANYEVGGVTGSLEVEPTTSWNAFRIQKEFNAGHQGFGIISTVTQRFFNESSLPDQMNRGAYTLGIDGWTFLDAEQELGPDGMGWRQSRNWYRRADDEHPGRERALLPAAGPGLHARRLGGDQFARLWRTAGREQATWSDDLQRLARRNQSRARAQRPRLRSAGGSHQQRRRRRLSLDQAHFRLSAGQLQRGHLRVDGFRWHRHRRRVFQQRQHSVEELLVDLCPGRVRLQHGERPWHSRRAGHAAARRIWVRCRLQQR